METLFNGNFICMHQFTTILSVKYVIFTSLFKNSYYSFNLYFIQMYTFRMILDPLYILTIKKYNSVYVTFDKILTQLSSTLSSVSN